ncbi:hypothetical protein, partial [Komagataeibacter intermedius]|uniref:hypothetical protein n=1 Tax=Komagataeibacter intermedius TaxID=66229 RepID=UPI00222F1002
MSEPQQHPISLHITKPPPFDISNKPVLRADAKPDIAMGQNLHHIAIISDRGTLSIHTAPCPTIQPKPVARS